MNTHTPDSLHAVFMLVLRSHRRAMHNLLQDQEVHPGQPPLLIALSEQNGQSQKELAERLRITPATLTVMLNRTEKNGLVERRPDEKDQRMTRVYLTEKGEGIHNEVVKALQLMEALCFEHFSGEEQETLRRLLLKMFDNLQRGSHLTDPDQEQEEDERRSRRHHKRCGHRKSRH
ncbi:MarR family winged helix-turn-helix transcriptional regulator [Paenibacillus piri]|uniref:MarR family transcriptional regulator n=1 Tax=Paenibacillus piri TaxID=2547395 RepID=A0A4R5KJ74_9BACL|nr:MarR family transcriptional regulator [Paenibacillus piri]TDF94497.1 MarR family transcriptional regulator [Paenibacillus piri]